MNQFSADYKAIVLLKALCLGLRIQIGSRVYLFSQDYELCVVAWNETTHEEAFLKVNLGISLQEFMELAGTMTDDELVTVKANLGLNVRK